MKIFKNIFFKICSFILIFSCALAFALDQNQHISLDLKKCLISDWGIDNHTAEFIHNKFKTLLNDPKQHKVIKEFIHYSKEQRISFPVDKAVHPLPRDDGIYVAPKEHLIVFENPYIRVLWGSTQVGIKEGLHAHHWKSIMVILKPTTYQIEYPNGSKETAEYPIGTYKLPAGEKYSCINVGSSADEYLRFEIKS